MSCGGGFGGCGFTTGGGSYSRDSHKVKSPEDMTAFEHKVRWIAFLLLMAGGLFLVAGAAEAANPAHDHPTHDHSHSSHRSMITMVSRV